MRKRGLNKLMMTTILGEEENISPAEVDAAARFTETPRHKLSQRMHARSRRRAKNKMRRASKKKQR